MEQISLFSLLKAPRKRPNKYSNIFMYKQLYIFLIRKPYQRSIHLSVETGRKVQVSCSSHLSLKKVYAFLDTHWPWIQNQVLEERRIEKKYPPKKFRSGESFLFQGKKIKLKYKKVFLKQKLPGINENLSVFNVENNYLIYYWRNLEDLNSDNLKIKLTDFYETTGKKILSESIHTFSSRMQLVPKSIRISSQRTLWGSCSSEGNISLNWRLVAASREVLNYVVIHELAHLKHLSHSSDFWSLVSRFCPNYKEYEIWLKNNVHALDFLLPSSKNYYS